ncbi:restriction endonuclease subunit S [Methylocaldum sp.]|uniref:restriction endonuclease subunit S n=1 Tax=Methylocaldum sp. TaxID=1969727 RepID=UPI002D315444|nr:restriction endonuclease subunit S [Methylocaldum sp.]HYE36310.1 restriction endonuclease subunit S [Methylocaldum sp.]
MTDGNIESISNLPDSWSLVRLGDIAKSKSGFGFPITKQGKKDGEFPFFKVSDMNLLGNEKFMLTSNNWIDSLTLKELKAKTFPKSAIVFPKIGAALLTNKKRILVRDSVIDNNVMAVVVNDESECLPNYLYQWFLTLDLGRIANPGTVPSLTARRVEEMKLPLPPFSEQIKIAGILSLVQQAIEQQERLLQLTAELKKTLLHQLFTQGLHGELQKQTEIGLVPESWAATTLGELACKPNGFLQTGPFGSQLHKQDYQPDGIGVINPTHLSGNRINHEHVPRVSLETAARLNRHLLQAGDILFARRGEIGRHGMVTKDEENWLCGTGCFLARVRQKHIDNRFLSHQFSTQGAIAWLNSHAAGAIMPNLNNRVLRSMPIFYPSRATQVEIANTLDAVEQKLAINQRKRATLTDLFRTLLHQLMTAQIRVHDIDMPDIGQSESRAVPSDFTAAFRSSPTKGEILAES